MSVYFVSRHPGALEWAREEGLKIDHSVLDLNPEDINSGDVIIGSLPVNLVAHVCERGGRYLHLSLDLSADLRGKELTAEDMRRCGARLEEYVVRRVKSRE